MLPLLWMIAVFWLEHAVPGPAADTAAQARYRLFGADALQAALRFAEELRASRQAGAPISHVTLQSELPGSVGHAGVADPPPDYAHYKRRLDPGVPLGRPSGPGRTK